MKKTVLLFVLLLGVSAFAERWDSESNPENMGQYNYHFNQLPQNGRIDDAHMPWSDNYWESDWGGISLRWNTLTPEELDPDGGVYVDKRSFFRYTPPSRSEVLRMSKAELAKLSPAEKYDILMGRYDYPTVRSERERTSPNMKDWQGICHGWVPAAINHSEPLPTEASNSDGVVVPFGSTDVKGLLSYYYGVPAYSFARGAREVVRSGNSLQVLDALDGYDLPKWFTLSSGASVYANGYSIDLNRMTDSSVCNSDENVSRYGSVEKCKESFMIEATVENLNLVGQVGKRGSIREPNAGAFHVVLTNQIALMNRAFVGNINKKIRNGEIWNQPIMGYNTSIDSDNRHSDGSGTVNVTTTLNYVSEIPQLWEPVVGTAKQRFSEMTFSYSLDLDRNGNIVGGHWAEKAYHPSFLWKHDQLEIKGYFSKIKTIYHSRY